MKRTIAQEMKILFTRFPFNKTQLIRDNSFSVTAFGKVVHTFSDGSHISEAV